MDIAFWSAKKQAAAIKRKKIGCLELLDHYLARVEKHDPGINAVVVKDVEAARKRARQADKALAKGDVWGPLHGVPMTIKESFDTVGMPTTWGLPELKDNYPQTDALAVQRWKAAGVTLFGKTNVPLMLSDWQSYNEVYGTTNNPWDLTRGPGGSSGGSAAALAAGLSGIEAGSDIGASIRNPAHYCGVYGHKPTYGICPPRGQALPGRVSASDISVIGPLGRSADDLAIGLAAMAGPDDIDGTGLRLKLPKPAKKKLKDFKVALVLTDRNAEVDQSVQDQLLALAKFLRKEGAKVDETARPDIDTDEAMQVYINLLRSATSGRQTAAQFATNTKLAAKLDPQDQGYAARMLRATVMPHKDWLGVNEQRHQIRLKWAAFFQDYDLLLCPTATTAAFKHNQKGERWERMITVNGKDQPTTDQLFWAGYSGAFYLPSTVAPVGLTAEGLPVGVQIIGPQYADRSCIAFAGLIEQGYYSFTPPPAYA
ncbi:MAG: amidase [Alphaproteobacteria bacterium]|nr:amidase [Alphaproteobacteria bacterium]